MKTRLWRFIPVVTMLLTVASTLSADESKLLNSNAYTDQCTLIGCFSGTHFVFKGFKKQPYDLEITIGDDTLSCENLHFGKQYHGTGVGIDVNDTFCSASHQYLNRVSLLTPPHQPSDTEPDIFRITFVSLLPPDLELKVLDGKEIIFQNLFKELHYQLSYPNGYRCDNRNPCMNSIIEVINPVNLSDDLRQ